MVDTTIEVNNEKPSQELVHVSDNIIRDGILKIINNRDNQDKWSRKILNIDKYLVKHKE